MKLYKKNNEIKTQRQIVIRKEGMATYNPTEEMILADGWVEYIIPEPTEDELFARAKQNLKNEIVHHDSSSEVNEFFINGLPVWLDKATRAGLKLRFEAEIAVGNDNTSLWYNNMQFPLSLSQAMQMLYAIEIYASACYDNTQYHLSVVENLTTREEVEAYDYRVGYPDKLRF